MSSGCTLTVIDPAHRLGQVHSRRDAHRLGADLGSASAPTPVATCTKPHADSARLANLPASWAWDQCVGSGPGRSVALSARSAMRSAMMRSRPSATCW